jgi:hypothetical protein
MRSGWNGGREFMRRIMFRGILACVAAVLGIGRLDAASVLQDSDGDGLSNDLERLLGTHPAQAEVFVDVMVRPIPAGFADPARFVTSVALANAGQDRFVWRVTFGDVYPAEMSLLQLYVDTDNDKTTGRKSHGCEFMLKIVKGQAGITAFGQDGTTFTPESFPSVAVVGRSAYVVFDTVLSGSDASIHRLQLLSERLEPHKGVDSIRYFVASGPPMSPVPKCRRDADLTESVGVSQTFGPRVVDPLVSGATTVRTDRKTWELNGFRVDRSEYRTDNVLRTSGSASIVVKPGVSGIFYPGFVIHDETGREVVEVRLNEKRLGVAVAAYNDNDQHLFFLTEPVSFSAADQLELRTLTPHGRYRIEDIVLLRNAPPTRTPFYEFTHVEVTEDRLTWISSWAVACMIEFKSDAAIEESGAVNNHRVVIPGLEPGKTVRYRITGKRPDGQQVASSWISYTRLAPVEPLTTASGRIPLEVIAGDEKVPAGAWPVTCGIPFPKGELGSERNVMLADGAGRTVPLQTEVTSRWSDGSVRWLLLDFRHAGNSRDYVVTYGPQHTRPVAALPEVPSLSLGTLALTDMQGRVHRQEIDRFEVVLRGPLRCELRSRGKIHGKDGAALYGYDMRVHSYPGMPWLRVQLSYGNCFEEAEFLTVRHLAWELPKVKGTPLWVRQHTDDHFNSSTGEGNRFSGATGPVFIRDFWQNYPKDVKVGSAGTTIGMMPPLKTDEYDWAKGTLDEHRLFYWFDAGGYKLRQGMTKTQDIWIGTAGTSPLLDRPLFAAAPPAWYQRCGVFGEYPLAAPEKTVVVEYDRRVGEAMGTFLRNREKNREYGQFNFGDWWGERVINWGNIEYDTQHAFLLHFVRTGDPRFFQAADEAEVHNRDIDTVHYHRSTNRIGRAYAHCIGHVGHYYDKSPMEGKNRGTARGGFTVTHTWTEGHTDHYFLTGDRRSLETAKSIADNYDRYKTTNYDFTNCRVCGWHLILSMAAYRATRDPYHLNACRIIVDRVLERHTPESAHGVPGGGWRRMMVPGHCLCEPFHHGNAGFMVGVLMSGLRHYHQETGDPAVAEVMHRAARFLIEDMWVPETKGFRYTSCPKSSKGGWSNLLLFDGISYAYRLRPDPLFAEIMTKGTDNALLAVRGFGKSFSQVTRVAPHCLGVLQQLRDNPVVPKAAKPQPN